MENIRFMFQFFSENFLGVFNSYQSMNILTAEQCFTVWLATAFMALSSILLNFKHINQILLDKSFRLCQLQCFLIHWEQSWQPLTNKIKCHGDRWTHKPSEEQQPNRNPKRNINIYYWWYALKTGFFCEIKRFIYAKYWKYMSFKVLSIESSCGFRPKRTTPAWRPKTYRDNVWYLRLKWSVLQIERSASIEIDGSQKEQGLGYTAGGVNLPIRYFQSRFLPAPQHVAERGHDGKLRPHVWSPILAVFLSMLASLWWVVVGRVPQ